MLFIRRRLKKSLYEISSKNRTMNKKNQKSAKNSSKPKTSTTPNLNVIPAASKVKFEVLPQPVKSSYDKKHYKVIRLENGLTACLVSDLEGEDTSLLSNESDSESDYETDDTDSEADSVKSVVSEEDDSKAKKVKEVKQAAAALCVSVGSFSDPKEVPGLAHFLEHMVFMGSTKFPQENDFDSFIKKHGGSDNASTDSETTVFYFECFEKHLYRALDKFAQFFKSPLMKRESITREREAVESEFQMALPSDEYRKEQLLSSFLSATCPINSFTWGNLITLRDNISEDELYKCLHEFRIRHYSANRMTVAIQARLPMDMLESYVVDCFSGIANNGLSADDKSCTVGVFDTPQFKRMYYIKPMKDICELDLTWALPSLLHMYRAKPHVYLSWILGHEGKGSLLSYLKKRVWALSIYTGNGESGIEHNSLYSFFSICLVLTAEGLAQLPDLIEAVFSYIEMLKKVGPQERIFNELKIIEETSFKFAEEESAADLVEELAENMQFYAPEDYLTGSEFFFEYNEEAIKMVTNELVPDKMNIMILTSEVPSDVKFNKTEKWFNTPYSDVDIPTEWLKRWSSVQPYKDFVLPESNRFLTNDFNLLPEDFDIPKYPEKIIDTPLVELWYRKDQKFNRPQAFYYYYLIAPLSMDSCISICMTNMLVILLEMDLTEEGYPAQIAELSYCITPCEKGISIKVDGYNEKLPILIEMIANYLKNISSNLKLDVFEAVKEKLCKSFYNAFLKPSRLAKDVRFAILQKQYWSLVEKHSAVSQISFTMMQEFSKNLTKNLFIQGLVQGNITAKMAQETTQKLIDILHFEPIEPDQFPKIIVNQLPLGEHCCRIQSFNENDVNCNVTNYYQSGTLTIKSSVITEFILLLIEEPLFDILRTKEQLGYYVSSTLRDTHGILGFSITIIPQVDKFSTEYVDSRIESFIKHSQKLLNKLSGKKIKQIKNDLIKIKRCVDTELEDEVLRNWSEIVSQEYIFDRTEQEIKAVEELSIKEVKQWWDEHNSWGNKNNYRKLSIQVVGHKQTNTPDETDCTQINETEMSCETSEMETSKTSETETSKTKTNSDKTISPTKSQFKLKFVEDLEEIENKNKSKDYFISSITDFKNKLDSYPGPSKTN